MAATRSLPASLAAEGRPLGAVLVRRCAGLRRWFETFVGMGSYVLGLRSHGCVIIKKNAKGVNCARVNYVQRRS
jgi:hypothetical protein